MARKRTSIIWQLSKNDFQALVNECSSQMEILSRLGLNPISGNHRTLKIRFQEDNISIDHIIESRKHAHENAVFKNTIPLKQILVEHSKYTSSGSKLKRRLIKANLIIDQCQICGQIPLWNGKPLTLQLDHINGIHDDNRIENLRVLCPHCHSQTDTFGGRNASTKLPPKYCLDCDKIIAQKSIRCSAHQAAQQLNKTTKIEWPTDEDLLHMLANSNFTQVAKQLGVTDNSIRKRLLRRNLLNLV